MTRVEDRASTDGRSEGREGSIRRVRAVAIAFLVVSTMPLAGCLGFGGGGGKSWTVGGDDVPKAIESKLEVHPATIFGRVADIMGANASYPSITVTSERQRFRIRRSKWFLESMVGLPKDRNATRTEAISTYDPRADIIYVNEHKLQGMSPEALEIELAARFAHAIMFEQEWLPFQFEQIWAPRSLAAQRIVLEAYASQYNGSYHQATFLLGGDASMTEMVWQWAPHRFAYDWMTSKIDGPSGIGSILQSDFPTTSEQYLHDTADQPRNLSVEIDNAVSWISTTGPEHVLGEARTRWLLQTQLDRSTAVTAAEGWGNDAVHRITSNSNDSRVGIWALTWDTSADADEFESAIKTYIERRRSEAQNLRFEYHRLAANTTAVVFGTPSAVDDLRIGYANGTVTAEI